jgi:alpha-beta hydrolase superfamily lysophospholipase
VYYSFRKPILLILAFLGQALSSHSGAAQLPPIVTSMTDIQRMSESIVDQHGTLVSADHTCLFYRSWPSTENSRIQKVVIVLHGIGYHSGPYKVIADALNPRGINVFALDARGHGLSCGPRGYLGTPTQVGDDVTSILDLVRAEFPQAKIYLLGESMGGALALNFAKRSDKQLSGLILLAPAFNVSNHQLLDFRNFALLPYLLFARRTLAISLVDRRLEESSRDSKFIRDRRADPLAYQKISFEYLFQIKALVSNWRSEIAPRISIPTLIIQGDRDVIVSRKDCANFARIPQGTRREYKVYPEVRHTTLWDPATPEILNYVAQWIIDN